jgi:hypothetical protein
MANIVGPRSRRNDKQTRQPVIISAGIAVLAAVVSVCAGLAVVPLWTALVQGWRLQPIADQCKMLKGARTTEGCDEKLRVEGVQHPARGAKASVMLRSPEHQNH